MIEDLETLAAAEAAGLRLDSGTVDLAEVAAETVSSLAAQFAAADVGLTSHLTAATVTGDRFRLSQIVRNLLVNALKYTPAGGSAEISVAVSGDVACLTVADTGIGIPADDLPHIFDRFWRGNGRSRASGSGVGLAVVAHLVDAHGGSIDVESPPGNGTVFTARFPHADRETVAATPSGKAES